MPFRHSWLEGYCVNDNNMGLMLSTQLKGFIVYLKLKLFLLDLQLKQGFLTFFSARTLINFWSALHNLQLIFNEQCIFS